MTKKADKTPEMKVVKGGTTPLKFNIQIDEKHSVLEINGSGKDIVYGLANMMIKVPDIIPLFKVAMQISKNLETTKTAK